MFWAGARPLTAWHSSHNCFRHPRCLQTNDPLGDEVLSLPSSALLVSIAAYGARLPGPRESGDLQARSTRPVRRAAARVQRL